MLCSAIEAMTLSIRLFLEDMVRKPIEVQNWSPKDSVLLIQFPANVSSRPQMRLSVLRCVPHLWETEL